MICVVFFVVSQPKIRTLINMLRGDYYEIESHVSNSPKEAVEAAHERERTRLPCRQTWRSGDSSALRPAGAPERPASAVQRQAERKRRRGYSPAANMAPDLRPAMFHSAAYANQHGAAQRFSAPRGLSCPGAFGRAPRLRT
jgi:hypothetical protein